ncbi:MAG: twin-arginine translocase TatA/TatE family subunit [Chloroflexi bacterium]|nr:twin-arginine translocase TatA/TatE family subunit [Chloroflexota bacterium]
MDFLGIGPLELLMIFIIAMLLWGPSRMVEIARNLGKAVHSFRKAASDLTTQVTKEVDELTLKEQGRETERKHLPPQPPQTPSAPHS